MANIGKRIDIQISQLAVQYARQHEQTLPFVVDTVLLCAKQQIALRFHKDDKVDLPHVPTANEGNFIAIIRLLAESNPSLTEHRTSGAKNVRYTSKTV